MAEAAEVDDLSVSDSVRAAIEEVAKQEMAAEAAPEPVEEPEGEIEAESAPEEAAEAEEAPETQETDEKAADEGEEEAEEAPAEVVEVALPPQSWNKEDREVFAKLGKLDGEAADLAKQAQAIIARREKARDDGLRQANGEIAPLKAVVDDYKDYFRQIGVTPDVSFRSLIAAEQALRFGTPQQKAEALQGIARSYGIEAPQAAAVKAGEEPEFTDPDIAAIRQEFTGQLGEIKGMLESRQQAEDRIQSEQVDRVSDQFFEGLRSADAKARPEARYIDETLPTFFQMVKAARESGETPDVNRLNEIFSNAAWSVPSVRERMSEDMAAQRQAEVKPVKRKVVKVASSPAGGTGSSAHSKEPDMNESVRDSVRRTIAEFNKPVGALR